MVSSLKDDQVEEFMQYQRSSRNGLKSILKNLPGDNMKHLIITPKFSQTIKYVRRVKGNDFAGP